MRHIAFILLTIFCHIVSASENEKIQVNVSLLEYIPSHFWSQRDATGSGPTNFNPAIRLEVIEPEEYKKREFTVVLVHIPLTAEEVNSGGKIDDGFYSKRVGQSLTFKIPKDFLPGDYGRIFSWDVIEVSKQNEIAEPDGGHNSGSSAASIVTP